MLFVYRRVIDILESSETSFELSRIHWGWLILSGIIYILGWLPGVWFWRQLLFAHRAPVKFYPTLRAYYCGHLGKYIPGKAMALVIRSALLKVHGVQISTGILTATYETLASMGTGAAIAIALLPRLLKPLLANDLSGENVSALQGWAEFSNHPWLFPIGVVLLTICLLPVFSMLISFIARKSISKELTEETEPPHVSLKLLILGVCLFTIGWCLHGLSLGCVLKAVSDEPFNIADLPIWVGTISLATVSGFAALFSPGGLGIREIIIVEMLRIQPGYHEQQAVSAAFLLRVVWFLGEIIVAIVVFWVIRKKQIDTSVSL